MGWIDSHVKKRLGEGFPLGTGKLVGHSIFCVYDLLLGRVDEADVHVVYLSRSVLERLHQHDQHTRMRVAGIESPDYLEDDGWRYGVINIFLQEGKEAYKARVLNEGEMLEPDAALVLYERVAAMWKKRLIQARPELLGAVGKAYWTRNGKPETMPWGEERLSTEPRLI